MIIVLKPDYKIYIDFIKKEEEIKTPLFLFTDEHYLVNIKNKKRLNEIISTHYLLYKILKSKPQIYYNKKGKPYIKDKPFHISISHSGKRITIGISEKQIGVDIQKTDNRLVKISHKFVNARDKETLGFNINSLTLIWSAKEAVYKLDNNQVKFTNLHINKVLMQNKYSGQLLINNMWTVDYFIFEKYYLTIAKSKNNEK